MTTPPPSDNASDMPQLDCPVCGDCEHDFRSGLLALIDNMREGLTLGTELFLDGVEGDEVDHAKLIESIDTYQTVRRQLAVLIEVIPDVAAIKAEAV